MDETVAVVAKSMNLDKGANGNAKAQKEVVQKRNKKFTDGWL